MYREQTLVFIEISMKIRIGWVGCLTVLQCLPEKTSARSTAYMKQKAILFSKHGTEPQGGEVCMPASTFRGDLKCLIRPSLGLCLPNTWM